MKQGRPQKYNFRSNIREVAMLLGVDVTTMRSIKEAHPVNSEGKPFFRDNGKIQVDGLAAWVAANGDKITKAKEMAKADGEVSGDLKEQKLAEEIRKLRIRNDHDERRLIPVAEHNTILGTMAAAVRGGLAELPSRVASSLVGCPDAAMAEGILDLAIREALTRISEWETSHARNQIAPATAAKA